MSDSHLHRALLWALAEGRLSYREFAFQMLEHLERCCPTCREELLAFQLERRGLSGSFPQAFGVVMDDLKTRLTEEEVAEERATRELVELRRLAWKARLGKVRRARKRFASPELALLMLEEARGLLPGLPEQAESWVRLARLVCDRARGRGAEVNTVRVRVEAHLGNALRLRGEFSQAETAFGEVRDLARRHGVADPKVLAEVDGLEGSLWKDLRFFERARDLFRRAACVLEQLGDRLEAAHAWIGLSLVAHEEGDYAAGISAADQALELRPDDDRLRLCAVHCRVNCLCDGGEPERARQALTEATDCYDRFPEPAIQRRRRWVAAKVAAGLGEMEQAEGSFQRLSEEFAEEGTKAGACDAALVLLDLAQLYLEQGQNREVQALAETILTTLRRHGIERDAVLAATLLYEAAEAERLTASVLQSFGRLLEAVQRTSHRILRPGE